MPARATEGTCLAKLVRLAIPLCKTAQSQCPRTGPGQRPEYDDWKMAVMIMAATLKRRKSKSAQYRFLCEHHRKLRRWLGLKRFPARSTYFSRYPRLYRLFEVAIALQARQALCEGVTTARSVAADKSLLSARGKPWHGKRRIRVKDPPRPGVDRQADWGFSPYHEWVYGYSYEVVTTAEKGTVHLPLVASAGVASASEHKTLGPKIDFLPPKTRFVLADSGYDDIALGERVERDRQGRPTGRRFVCPPNRRGGSERPSQNPHRSRPEQEARRRRWKRIAFYQSPRGQKLYVLRTASVEPLHERLKSLFDMDRAVWHRGLGNTQTQLLGVIFCYQLLLRYNHRCGRHNAQVQWILESL